MKKFVTYLSILISILILQTCGAKGEVKIEGPYLDLSEFTALQVDQLMVNGGTDEGSLITPEFEIYLRNLITKEYVVCAGKEQGLDVVKSPGIYYGNLRANLIPVEEVTEESGMYYEVVFVEKDSLEGGCPDKPREEDIFAVSSSLGVDETGIGSLIDNEIQAPGDLARARLIIKGGKTSAVPVLDATQDKSLIVDQVYFSEPDVGDETALFSLYLSYVGGGSCYITYEQLTVITESDIIYGWLNKPFECTNFEGDDTESSRKVTVSLAMHTSDGSDEVGKTDVETIGNLIGKQVDLKKNGNKIGYIVFRGVLE